MKALLFSNFELPDSCANASRVFAFAKMLKYIGWSVEITGISYKNNMALSGTYENFPYKMIPSNGFSGIKARKRILALENDIKEYLQQTYKQESFNVIFLSNIYYDFSKCFIDFAKKYKLAIIVNEVEWYEKNNEIFDGFGGKIKFLKNRIALKNIHVKMKNIVAISSLLGNYYSDRGCCTCVVPTILDMSNYENIPHSTNQKTIISYAGSPAKKDLICNVILALEYLTLEEKKRLEFHFYGATDEDFIKVGVEKNLIEKYKGIIICHGRIPHDEVKTKIAESDFTVLLRPDLKYANAGFPTKVGESMACGTPVIANITSDLEKYIIDGKTGIVCENETPQSCAKAIQRAIRITKKQLKEMRKETKNMAYKAFDYRVYGNLIKDFLRKIKY